MAFWAGWNINSFVQDLSRVANSISYDDNRYASGALDHCEPPKGTEELDI